MIQKKEVVLNSVAEFLGIWAVRGKATLSLETKEGVTTIAFSHSLSGHPEDPLHPPPVPSGLPQQRLRRRRGPARRERDRQRAARHQAAKAGAPPASSAASPAAPSTPEGLREARGSNLDTLAISPTNEKREEEEEEDLPTPDLKPEHPPWWKEDDEDWSIDETLRIANEMGRTGKCIFCDFTCEPNPGVASWYNEPLLDHRDEAHPETVEWFY